jgi:signal transduction histidine kinase
MGKFLKELIASLTVPSDVHVTLWENWPNLNAAPALLQQIFLNLIDNAIKFNRATHKLVEIGWRDLDNDQYEFFVRDNGIGIKPRYTEQIFGVFERLHTSEEFPGTGIGLAIVKKAIHSLRGSIRLESTPGEGTTFFVAFSKVQQGI